MMLPGGCLGSTCWDIQARLWAKRSQTASSRSGLGLLTNWLTRAMVCALKGSLLRSQIRMTFRPSARSALVTASNSVVLPVPLGPSMEMNSERLMLRTTRDKQRLQGAYRATAS
ncbi:hypothetical protein D3C80_1794720 [compost metagenome]